jgi:uncharacterized protein (DUF2267 family)
MVNDQSAISFIKRVSQKYPALEQQQLKLSIQAVLMHLLKNLPLETEKQFFAALPEDIRTLASTPELEATLKAGQKTISWRDQRNFLTKVKIEGGLSNTNQAKDITYAVLSSVAELLPADKSLQIRSKLPDNIRHLWTEALQEQSTYSLAMQHFQKDIRFHFIDMNEGQVRVIILTVVTHFIHRFGNGSEGQIIHYLPEEVRLIIGHLEPPRGGRKRPAEHLAAAELIQIVQQEANLESSEDAKQALLGVFRAIKKATTPINEALIKQMPHDWAEYWERS